MQRWFWKFARPPLVLAACLLSPFAEANQRIVTNSDDAGPGTLRQAIADSVSGDNIVIADTVATITLTNGELLITNDLTIVAPTATIAIDASGNSRVLEIAASNTVTLDSLIITNGHAADLGGGILVNQGVNLMLTNCTVAGNSADSLGGGIYTTNGGTITINNSILSGNSTGGNGGGIANDGSILLCVGSSFSLNNAAVGGGILNQNSGIVAINNCTLSDNTATNLGGGMINTNSGVTTINNSTISGNSCPADQGGGIDNWGMLTVNDCTIAGNHSGGGLVNTSGTAVCNNSTFSGNVALFDGGGFYSFGGTSILNNCTISGNSANRRAGGVYQNTSTFLATNTIVAGNTAVSGDPDLLGSVSGGNNLIGGDPLLAPLGNYGGPTQTMPPLAGSPAFNAGTDSVTNLFATDQRGYPRLAGTHVDIGAVEIQPVVVINTNDDGPGSLRATVAAAPPLINFTNALSGQTIYLTSGQITVSNSVEIDASSLTGGIAIDAGGNSRVLEITASNTVTFNSLTITNGNVLDEDGGGGGILVDQGVSLTLANCIVADNLAIAGGGIYDSLDSTVSIDNSTVSGNSAVYAGGGIENYRATLTINSSAFSGNVSTNNGGGGIFNMFGTNTVNNCVFSNNASLSDQGGGFVNEGGLLVLNSCTVVGNSPGGGIDAGAAGSTVVDNSTISSNSATTDGGGIWNSGALTLNNCTLFGNSAGNTNNGGGIFNILGTNTLINCTISSNSAGSGGGIFQGSPGMSLLTNTIVAGNTAANASDIFGTFDGVNNLIGGNPLLAPFGDYGGPTLSMPPMFGSAAIDAGLDSATAAFLTDQRGFARQSGSHVDIGAVEAQLAPTNNRPILKVIRRRQPGGGLSFSFTNTPTADFTVIATTNLLLPLHQWSILGPPTQNPPGQYQFTDSAPRNSRTWFYLVVSP